MLGLLQKDIYQIIKYQRILMLIVVIFAAAAAKNTDNAFFTVYPAVIAGLSMVTLQSYDEQSGFSCYSSVMPIPKRVVVGEKYLCGAGLILLVALVEAISYLIFQNSMTEALRSICFIAAVGLLSLGLFLPFVFWLGPERGRTAYVVAMAVFCSVTLLLKNRMPKIPTVTLGSSVVIAAVLTVVSFGISVVLYKRRAF